jgi:branched-chain amino acid transport system substrate-binding protein
MRFRISTRWRSWFGDRHRTATGRERSRRAFLGNLLTACALAQEPYKDASKSPHVYEGPGRDEPAPAGLTEIRIGFFGPSDPSHPEGGTIWQGASRAIEEANRAGGYRGLPFRLVSRWSDNPWRAGAAQVVRLAYEDHVWAIVGGIDGPTTHLAEQVVAKALLTLVSPASTDRSVNLAGVPWMFSCMPGDDLLAGALVQALSGERELTLISATDHDSRAFTAELKKAMGSRGLTPAFHVEFDPGKDAAEAATRAKGAPAVALVAGPAGSVRFLRALRASGFGGRIYAGPWVARLTALDAAEGVVFPFPLESPPEGFPDYAAVYAYDATNLVIAAIRKAGLNRVGIYDVIRGLSTYSGATGAIRFDALGRNPRPVRLATVEGGRLVILPRGETK